MKDSAICNTEDFTPDQKESLRAFFKERLEQFRMDELLDRINNPLAYKNPAISDGAS
jgi:hypothetical protein